ncbi:hypothetical protein GCM10017714_21160 [Curtobacterium pusillum]|uniref:Uncharacterized protein n=1 Tax=Curtobacterium pusillum TaxID=69373 RepID=A0ABX2MAA7_9MICO|nr:hypothetical protein [Curtobacterium pusillum]NUU14589.1 hypothetical protein [Curtobacterium pusillum]GLK31977.1 hypothetical protein GCM10017610_22620 [Curtobacterium pusillum]
MTQSRTTIDVYPTRVRSSYSYDPDLYAAPRPFRRAQAYPWWIWVVGPLLTVGVVFVMLQVA